MKKLPWRLTMNTFGKNIRISLFGESHGEAIGITIDGLPAGLAINHEKIKNALKRRQGLEEISTPRREPDEYQIISGSLNNHTTGAPLTFIIPNQDIDSKPYGKLGNIRPGHADLSLFLKFKGQHDHLGGGHASGRLTAPLIILGVFCEELLNRKGIIIASRIKSLKNTTDTEIDSNNIDLDTLIKLRKMDFPVIDRRAKSIMLNTIKKARNDNDSLGGTIETFIFGVPGGIGEPFFNSVESYLAHLMFAIPGIKGIEFGAGFRITKKFGSEVNDQLIWKEGKILFLSNNSGGIQGGITNGNTITFTVAIKPTSSIARPQQSIDYITGENIMLTSKGRHDPTFVHRALPVIDSLTSFGILDLLLEEE